MFEKRRFNLNQLLQFVNKKSSAGPVQVSSAYRSNNFCSKLVALCEFVSVVV